MPSVTTNVYGISFHPSTEEWHKYKEAFLLNFMKLYHKEKYILTTEKGNNHQITHYQGFVEFTKERRGDTVKKSAQSQLLKDMDISYPLTALFIRPITRDVKYCQGYPLKETSDDLREVVAFNYSLDYLLECKEYHLQELSKKKCGKDKQRLNIKNLPEIVRAYIVANKDKYFANYDFFDKDQIQDPDKIKMVLARMGIEDYYVLPILLRKDINEVCKYLLAYLTGNIKNFSYLWDEKKSK